MSWLTDVRPSATYLSSPGGSSWNSSWSSRALSFHVDLFAVVKIPNSCIESKPSAMETTHLTERIHAIRTQTEPYIPHIQFKVFVGSIYFSPQRPISWVSKHRVLLAFLFVSSHQLSILFISKQMFQTWYYRRVPHDLGRNSLPGTLPKRGIMGEYHMTLVETLFRGCSPRHPQDHLF